MKVSHSWLQSQFAIELPNPEDMAELFTFRSFEVEGIEVIDGDPVYDLKVLPDRAHYALSWNGLAYEVSAALKAKRKYGVFSTDSKEVVGDTAIERPVIHIENKEFCSKYFGRIVREVKIGHSPEFLVSELRKMGQRSINSIVDAANYAMFQTGQPLHAFDADKVVGAIVVRAAKKGETITTLDGKEVVLHESDTVIADETGPLAIAGIKGGKKAEVTLETKNLILEAAHFNPVSVRRTSTRVQIKNDSSKRFENEIPTEFADEGMKVFSELIARIHPEAKFGLVNEVLTSPSNHKTKSHELSFSLAEVSALLGVDIDRVIIASILDLLGLRILSEKGDIVTISVPYYRSFDVVIDEDVVEEVGRLYGYENIPPKLPQKKSEIALNPRFVGIEALRSELINAGFSESILYTLGGKGFYETAYPVASDKAFLRTSLLPNLEKSITDNTKNSDLLETERVKQFEIGKVFDQDGEKVMLGIAVGFAKKVKGESPKTIVTSMAKSLGLSDESVVEKGLIAYGEWMVEELVDNLGNGVKNYASIGFGVSPKVEYKPISPYPFAVRDVAVFVPSSVSEAEVRTIVESEAGSLCVSVRLFDVFTKNVEGVGSQTSYAFRLVFQANDRTLEEKEIVAPVEAIYQAFEKKGWTIR